MMQHFLTQKVFEEGLQEYLKNKQLSAATSDDLFEELQKAVNANKQKENVAEIMKHWVGRKGYPVLTVNINYNDKQIEVNQKRFYAYNATEEEIKDDTANPWHVPFNYAIEGNFNFSDTAPTEWLTEVSKKYSVPSLDPKKWFILNKQQTGYYRVNYENANWNLIINYLNTQDENTIHVLNRAQLIDDALAFVQNGLLDADILLHLLSHLKKVDDYVAWYPGFKALNWFNKKLANTDHYKTFKKYVFNITSKVAKEVGYEEKDTDKHLVKLNRIPTIHWACLSDDSSCLNKMREKVEAWINDSKKKNLE
jgi:aminopeptidase N